MDTAQQNRDRHEEDNRVIEDRIPEISLQQLIDAGLNGFGLQLFMESVITKKDAKIFEPFLFIYKGVKVTLAPEKNSGVVENG